MIVLKHLAREFNLTPAKTREKLRQALGTTPSKRWKWDENDPQLKLARQALSGAGSKQSSTPKTSPSNTSTKKPVSKDS